MANELLKDINESLQLDFKNDDGIWIKSGMALWRLLGILGLGLPIFLLFVTFVFFGLGAPLESISHYYFTRAGTFFTTVMSLIGVFLIVYKGKEPVDFYVSTVAGIGALVVAFLPTGYLVKNCCDNASGLAVTFLPENAMRETVHLIAAGIFISLLAGMSLFLFTKSNLPTRQQKPAKRHRNRVYRICGILMMLALLVIGAGFRGLISREWYTNNHLTFWMESLAVEAFGFSWLVKGEAVMGD